MSEKVNESSQEFEEKIEVATDSILRILESFSEQERKLILSKIKVAWAEDQLAEIVSQQFSKSVLGY